MSRGLGQTQLRILALLQESGGALATAGLLAGLFDQIGPGAHSSLSRTLRALRTRGLVKVYKGVAVGGRGVVVAAITGEGAEVARGIEWQEGGNG